MFHVVVLVGVWVFDSANGGLDRPLVRQLLDRDVTCSDEWLASLSRLASSGAAPRKRHGRPSYERSRRWWRSRTWTIQPKACATPNWLATCPKRVPDCIGVWDPGMARCMTHILPGASYVPSTRGEWRLVTRKRGSFGACVRAPDKFHNWMS